MLNLRRETFRPLDLDAIRADHSLVSVAGAVVKLQRAGAEWKGCCPFHSDRTPSFTIFSSGERFHCFGCGASGDVLDFIQRLHGVQLREAADMLTGGDLPSVHIEPAPVVPAVDRVPEAKAIWRNAVPAAGTPVETYLRSRGLDLHIPESIRCASLRYGTTGPEMPVLIASVASADNKLVGVQRTFLKPDGSGKADVPKPKLSLGKVSGGAIRCAPAARCLILCEGLEDALTLQQELGLAAWCAAGASMLPSMILPAGVEEVAIGGDADDAGKAAANKAAETFARRGLRVRVFFPSAGFKDFNEELMKGSRA